jgi:golgi apparatus protein 1
MYLDVLQELGRLEFNMAQDYRLNYRLQSACQTDVAQLCDGICKYDDTESYCGGKVLQCLVHKKDAIKSHECKQEVFYFIKMEVWVVT